jgi:tetratricopeptide (TPR) repeat protein
LKQLKCLIWALLIFTNLSILSSSYAQSNVDQVIINATKDFEQGRYDSTIKILENLNPKRKQIIGVKAYLVGLAYNKLQAYDLAVESFKIASQYNHPARDLYYEFGQALYANNQLEQARTAFIKSYKTPHKVSESLYYMAYISQLLLEYKKAISYYKILIKTDKEDPSLRQIARFQMAESILSLAENLKEKVQKRVINKTVLPLLKLALKTDPNGEAYKDIEGRIFELQNKFGLDPNKMVNGRRISKKRWNIYAAQRLKFDDNVTLANDQPTVTTTRQDSYISESVIDISHEQIFQRQFVLEYGARAQNILHHDRSTAEVFSNDRYIISPKISGRWEHKLAEKMASTQLDLSYDYTAQASNVEKERSFFSRALNFTLSEKIRLFSLGDTTFKINVKRYRNKENAQHFDSVGFGINQIAILPNQDLVVAILNYTDVDSFNNTNASTASLILRGDYIMTDVLPKTDVTFSFTFNALDTKEQSDTRGTEKTISPRLKLSRKISNSLRLSLEHERSKRSSQRDVNEYDKSVTKFELRYIY